MLMKLESCGGCIDGQNDGVLLIVSDIDIDDSGIAGELSIEGGE